MEGSTRVLVTPTYYTTLVNGSCRRRAGPGQLITVTGVAMVRSRIGVYPLEGSYSTVDCGNISGDSCML